MNRRNQQGNALFLILIAVALFGALSFALTQGSRNANTLELREKNNLYASEAIAYGNAIKNTMEQMILLKDIQDNNVNNKGFLFSHPDANSAYGTYGNQPETEIFNQSGGNVAYQKPNENACTNAANCTFEYTGQYLVAGLGDDTKAELSMVLAGVTEDVCKALNKVSGYDWDYIPLDKAIDIEHFKGSNYADNSGAIIVEGALNELKEKGKFCYQEDAGAKRYIFVYVLKSR